MPSIKNGNWLPSSQVRRDGVVSSRTFTSSHVSSSNTDSVSGFTLKSVIFSVPLAWDEIPS